MTTKTRGTRSNSTLAHARDQELEDLRSELATMKASMRNGAIEVRDSGARVMHSAGQAAHAVAGRVVESGVEQARAATERVKGTIAEKPLTSVAVAAATGAAIASLLLLFGRRS